MKQDQVVYFFIDTDFHAVLLRQTQIHFNWSGSDFCSKDKPRGGHRGGDAIITLLLIYLLQMFNMWNVSFLLDEFIYLHVAWNCKSEKHNTDSFHLITTFYTRLIKIKNKCTFKHFCSGNQMMCFDFDSLTCYICISAEKWFWNIQTKFEKNKYKHKNI